MRTHLIYILCLFVGVVQAQLLDDSTKQIYSTKTVRYQLEESIVRNDSNFQAIDTNLYDFHIYNYTYSKEGPRQDLGALGSPTRSIYPEARKITGVQLGMDNTSFFAFENNNVKYFDTKSPFSELNYFQNFKKQEYFDALFTRSAGENFNFGFKLTRLGSSRQLGANPSGSKFIDTYGATMFTHFKAFKNKYEVVANYKYYDYEIAENGGVFSLSKGNNQDSLFGDFTQVSLEGVGSQDRRSNYHLYQQFSFDSLKSIQVFHSYDRERRRTIYNELKSDVARTEINNNSNSSFYDFSTDSLSSIIDSTIFTVHENKLGFKGNVFDVFYMGYVRSRSFDYARVFDSTTTNLNRGNELYYGGVIQRDIMDGLKLSLQGEASDNGYLLSTNSFKHKQFEVGFNYVVSPPSLLEQSLYNDHFNWSNTFHNQTDTEIKASTNFKFQGLSTRIFAKYLMNTDLIYYDQTATPVQYDGKISTVTLGGSLAYTVGKFRFSNELTIGNTSNSAVIRIPTLFNHFQTSFKTTPKGSHYIVLLGVDVWSRSSYYANAYMPYIQQFYLQDEFLLNAYTWADVFLSLEIKNARIFLKMPHVTQGLMGKGYFVTPYYYGSQRVLELGFNWKFFD